VSNVVPLHRQGELPDAALVADARAGEGWAKEALFRRHARRVMALAHRLLPEDDPEDVAQDVFVRALDQLNHLQHPGAFGGWLQQITVSIVKTRLRKRRWLRRIGVGTGDDLDPDSLVAAQAPESVKVELRDLYRAARRMSDECRVALLLQRVEGLELSEVAQRMGVSVATVKRRVVEADQLLKEVKGDA
jgi:RNA polymerase sigma-70 factor (ECF subfamily)